MTKNVYTVKLKTTPKSKTITCHNIHYANGFVEFYNYDFGYEKSITIAIFPAQDLEEATTDAVVVNA